MAGSGYKTFAVGEVLTAANVQGYLMDQAVMKFADSGARGSAIGTATEGMVSYLDDTNALELYDGSAWVGVGGADGYVFSERVVYESNATWTKADYADIKAVMVTAIGAGGGGGGSSNVNGKGGGGGGSGALAQSFILEASLGSTETVTIGAGGSGGAYNADGANGTNTSFGTAVVADAGNGGGQGNVINGAQGGARGLAASSTGTVTVNGQDGFPGTGTQWSIGAGPGGDTVLGVGGGVSSTNGNGDPGYWGGGGGGGARWSNANHSGGNGGDGVVIVDIYK